MSRQSSRIPPASALWLTVTLLSAAGCGFTGDRSEASVDDVDQETPITVTDEELAAFDAPADSVITAPQLDAYLKTSLLQFDLVRKESETLHEKVQEMEQRAEKGGALGALRNAASGASLMYQISNTIGGSYIRAARTLGHNPAEMEWVRERMVDVSAYLAMKPMQEAAAAGVQQIEEQAEQLRVQLEAGDSAGYTAEDVDQMLASAEEMRAAMQTEGSQAVMDNIDLLREARPAVSEPMWTTIGFVGGAMGLAALAGLGDPDDAEAQQKLDEFRRLFEDAINNRTSPGMEAPGS